MEKIASAEGPFCGFVVFCCQATNYLSQIYHLLILRYQDFVTFQFLLFALLCSFEVSEDFIASPCLTKSPRLFEQMLRCVLFSLHGVGHICLDYFLSLFLSELRIPDHELIPSHFSHFSF
jgi:hypothetical protein